MALYQRSLSDSLLLEDNVSGEYTDLHFLEGEDIVGASDQLELKRNKQKKNEAVDILKLINNDKEFSKHGLKSSRSLENLDMKAPVEVWKDSYDRLYNAKVKRFLKGSQVAKDKRHSKHGSGQETTETLDRKSKVNIATLLQNADRMCLAPSETEFDEKTRSSISHYDPRDSTGDLMRAKLKTNTARDFSSLQSKVNLTNVEHEINLRGGTYTDLEKDVGFNTPDRTLSHGQVSPVMHLTKGHFKTPKAVLNSPDMNMDVPSDNVEKSKFKLPKFSFSGNNNPDIKYDASMKGSPAEVAAGLNGPNIKIDGPKVDYKGLKTDLDMDMPSGKPKTALSGPKMMTSEMDVSTSKFNADCNSPDIKIRGQKPGMDVDLPKGNIKASNLNPPNLDLNASDLNVKAPSGPNLKIKSSDLNFKNSNVNEGINDPGMDLTLPHADLKNPNDFGLTGSKIQTPNYDLKTPEMDLSTPKLKTGLDSTDINIKCQKPDITDTNIDLSKGKITVPNLKTPSHDFNAHDLDINAPSGKIKMPKLKIFGNKPEGSSLKIKSSDLNLKTPKIKGGIDTPELNLTQPQTDLKAPNMDIKSPDASKLKMPRPHMNVDANIEQHDLDLSALTPKLNAGIKSPHIDINGPIADIKGPKTDLTLPNMDMPLEKKKMPTFKMPDFGLSAPNIRTLDADLKTPQMNLSAPKFKGDFNSPDLSISGHKPDITAPDMNGDFSKGKIKGTNLKNPNFDMDTPDFKMNSPSSKLKLQKFGISGSKKKGPDLKIKSPNLNIKSPKMKGGIDTPDMDPTLPQVNLKAPNLDLKSPDIDLKDPSGKFKMPSLGLPGLKEPHINVDAGIDQPDLNVSPLTPKLNAGINGPDIDIHGPHADFKGLKTDLKLPDMDMPSGKKKMPNFKMPSFGLTGPKLKTPDYDLKTPDMDLFPPKFKADFDSPDINLGHNIDVTAPNLNVDLPKGKIKGPDLKTPDLDMNAPDFDINASSGKMKLPKFGLSGKPKGPDFKINSPKLNLKSPKIKGGIDTPDMDMTLPQADFKSPNLDLKSPDIDLNGPSGKFNMAKPKMPSLNMSGLKGPHMNADVDHPDLNLTASTPKLNAGMSSPDIDIHGPGLKGPKTDLTVPDMDMPSGKMKLPNLKFPKLGLSGPKLKTPDYDLKTPEMDLSAPKFKADFDSPDLNLDNNLHVTAPDMNVDLPKGQMKALDLKKPNLDMRMPTGKINMPTLKMPKFGVSGTKIKTPDYDLKTPEMDLSAPEFKADLDTTDINIKGNKPDITGPDMDFDIPKGTFKGPNLKTPNFNMSAPDLDINAPSGKMKLPKFGKPKGTNFKMTYPKLTFKNPQNKGGIDIPQTDFKSPNLDADLDHPGLNLSASTPKLNAGINSPDMNVHGFNADHKGMTTDLTPPDINMPSGKMKLPNLKMPKFGLSGPKLKTPEYDLKNPEIGLSAPKADFDSPEFNIKGQKPEISGPDMDVNIPKNKFKGPSFKKPNIDMNAPDLDINSPSGKLKLPKFSLSGSKPKSPEFKVESQNLNLKTPQIKGGIDTPDMDLNLLQAKMKTPKLDLKSPDVDLNDPSGKFNMAKPKMPSLNSPGLKGPHMDADIDHPDLNLSASSKLNAGVKSPHIDIDGPNADFKVPKTDLTLPNMDMPSSKKKMPNFKIPDVGFTGPKINMPDYDKPAKINLSAATFKADLDSPDINFRGHKPDITAPDMNVNVPKSKINVPNFKKPNVDSNTPEIDIDAPSAKMKLPKIGLSDLKAEGPDFKMKSPKLKTKSPKINGGIDTPGMDLTLPQTDLKTSNLDFRPPDIDVNGPSGKFNMSKLKMPSLGLSGLKEPHFDDDIDHPDIRLSSSPPKLNAGTNHPDFNIHGPNGDFTLPKTEMPSGKIKTSTFKMPDIGFSGQKIKTPDYDLKAPNLDLFNSPDLSTRSHKPDFRVPDKNVDFPKGKIKATNFKPNLDVYTPELDNPDFQGLGSNDDFHDYTKMHANNFAIPRGNIKAGKTYDLDPSLRDIRMPNHQKYGTSKFTMQDPYFDLNSGMNISGKAQRPKMTRHLPDSPDVTMALPTPRPRTSGVVPTSSDVYYSEMSGAHRSRDHKRTGSNFEIDDSWNKISVPKLQAPTRTENLPVRNSNMGMSPKQISPHRGGDARYYRKTQMVPRRHYTTDDICYTYKGMPRRDGRGNEQSDYSRRRTMRHLQIQAMDLEVPESTLKGSKMNVLKLM